MPALNPQDDPQTPHPNRAAMQSRLKFMKICDAGTEQVRRSPMLIQHEREPHKSFRARLQRSVFVNFFELTLNFMANKAFNQPLTLSFDDEQGDKTREPPAVWGDFFDDVDLQGSSLDMFCKDAFRSSLRDGFGAMIVDYTSSPDENNLNTARALRPYWSFVSAENILSVRYQRIDSRNVVTHFRYYAAEDAATGFQDQSNQIIVAFDKEADGVFVSKYALSERAGEQPTLVSKTQISVTEVPVLIYYTQKQDTLLSKPPLLDLAYLNVAHYNSLSDQTNALTVARFPMLAASGVDGEESGSITVSPRTMLYASDPSSRFYYVEPVGTSISLGENDIMYYEAKMSLYGAKMLLGRPDRETSDARRIDSEESNASLLGMALGFEDALRELFRYTTMWYQISDTEVKAPKVTINKDFRPSGENVTTIQTLASMVDRGELDPDTLLSELKRLRLVAPDIEVAKRPPVVVESPISGSPE